MEIEFGAMLDRFGAVAGRWRLTDDEQVFVLGLDCQPKFATSPALDVEVETAMRLLIQLDAVLSRAMSEDEIVRWLRREPAYGSDPLTFMSLGVPHIRALLREARDAYEGMDDGG